MIGIRPLMISTKKPWKNVKHADEHFYPELLKFTPDQNVNQDQIQTQIIMLTEGVEPQETVIQGKFFEKSSHKNSIKPNLSTQMLNINVIDQSPLPIYYYVNLAQSFLIYAIQIYYIFKFSTS